MPVWVNAIALYVAAAYIFLRIPLNLKIREAGFVAINMAFVFYSLFYTPRHNDWAAFLFCISLVLMFYGCLRLYVSHPNGYTYALAILLPISLLVFTKLDSTISIVGFSYLVFRLTYLVFELHTQKASPPSLTSYLGFAFFPLTFAIGPISPYHLYHSSLHNPDRHMTPLARSLGRIWVGMLKVYLLAPLIKTMSFSGLWFDGYYHGINDFIIACISSWLFLYLNFSGAIDMIIGAAGVLNIRVQENFNNTLIARNIADFWSRMHITLTQYLRDMLFNPGVLYLGRLTGPKFHHVNIIFMTLLTFVLIGLWHKVSKTFVIFGLLHGGAMALFYLYSQVWRQLPVEIQGWANTWPWRLASTTLTFLFVSFTTIFFLHDWKEVMIIYRRFQW